MKIQCDKVLTVDDFSEEYATWKGRSLTIMDDQIKVSQDGLKPRYYDTIYLFEDSGILVGFTYNDVIPECYITTMDGLESEPFADVAPYIFEDLGRAYAVVKKQYRNTDLKKTCYRTQPRRNSFSGSCIYKIYMANVGMY